MVFVIKHVGVICENEEGGKYKVLEWNESIKTWIGLARG